MVPGTGQGQGEQERERTREFWLAEESETWGGDDGVPSVIGVTPAPAEHDAETISDRDDVLDLLSEDENEPGEDTTTAEKRSEPERLDAPPELRGSDWLS